MVEYEKPKVNIHHAVLYFAQQSGISAEFICKHLELDLEFLVRKNETLNTDQIIKFWNMANNFSGFDRPGIEFSKNVKLTYVGLMGELFSKLDTPLPLIPTACSVRNIITEMIHFDYSEDSETITLHVKPQGMWIEINEESSKSAAEYTLGNFFQIINHLVEKPIYPIEVGIVPSIKSRMTIYEDFFKCKIEYKNEFYLTYRKKDLLQKISSQNKNLQSYYQMLCNEQQNEEIQGHTLKSKIENIIFYTQWPNLPSGEEMASYLFISYKQLQRGLRKEATSYREVINEIKSQYATHMIKSGKFSITEISNILKYSDVSALSRAFKEYHGITLQEYKHQVSV